MRHSCSTAGKFALAAMLALSAAAVGAQSDRSAGAVIDDAAITSKVKAALVKDSTTKAADINVDARNGVVQLSGFVDSDAARKRAESIAGGVKGVSTVHNNLQLQSGERSAGRVVDDAAITAKVKSALIANPLTKAHQINVDTANSMVELSGFVDSDAAKKEAAKVAQDIAGVTSVENRLEVKK